MRYIQTSHHPYKSIISAYGANLQKDIATHDTTTHDTNTHDPSTLKPADNSQQTQIDIKLLGTPQIIIDGQELKLRSHRTFALIAYLCLELSPTPRQYISEILWRPEEQPTNDRLRVLLSKLRRSAPNLIISSAKHLEINPVIRQRTDAIQFLALHDEYSTDAFKQAIEAYTGDFLESSELETSSYFDKWLLHQQTIWREVLNFMYHHVIEELLTEGTTKDKSEADLREALFLAHKHLSIFPWSDEMIYKLVLIYIKKRQPDRALNLLNQYQARVSKEFDLQLPDQLHSIWQHLQSANIDLVIRENPSYFKS